MADTEARSKARKISNRRNLAALANDTKWTEFLTQVHSEAIEVEIKFIDAENVLPNGRIWIPSQNYIEGTQTGPELFVFIEWVRSSSVDEVSTIAKKVGLDYFAEDSKVTVYGYR